MNILRPDTAVNDLIWRYYSNTFEYEWRMDNPHHHDAVEFIYVAEGSCRLHFARSVIKPSRNDLIVVSSNSVHSCDITDEHGCTLINIHLLLKKNITAEASSDAFYNEFFSTLFSKDSFIRFFNCVELHPVIRNIAFELESRKDRYEDIVCNDVEKMLVLLCRKFNSRADVSQHTGVSAYVKSAVNYIENSITEELSVERIAHAVNLSPDYLMHRFSEEMHMSLMDFVRSRRIDFAKELLADSDMKIIDIAAESGFVNAQHFSTVFKKYAGGLTPRQFRAKSLQLNNRDSNIFK